MNFTIAVALLISFASLGTAQTGSYTNEVHQRRSDCDAGDIMECVNRLVETHAKELARFTGRDGLLLHLGRSHRYRNTLNKDTLYSMKNFKIIQKIKGGYMIGANPVVWNDGSSLEFDMAFLQTTKRLTPDLLISGVVYYSDDLKYTAINGFEQSAPIFKIPKGVPLLAVHLRGDPFTREEY